MQQIEDVRSVFTGTFIRFGEKSGYRGPVATVLLKDVRDESGKRLTGHLWFNLTKGFGALDMEEGDTIEFRARVKQYTKGYNGRREDVYVPIATDYKLSHPTKIRKIEGRCA